MKPNSSASIPYSTSIDVIKKELTNSIISSLTDNNSLAQFTVTLYNDVIKNTYDDIGKSQTIHFDATDDAGNKLENAIFTYILVNDYLTNIDQTTVHEISYRNANLNTIKTAYGINTEYTYELLNEDELVTNEGTITEELKEAINVEQTAKYKIIENNVEIGTFEYKFKIIDDVAPVMKWVDDNSIIDVDYLNDLTKEHDNNLNYNFFTTEFLTPVDLYNELKKYVYASDDISNCKLYLKVEISESKNILVYFYFLDESLNISKQIRFGAAITDDGIFNYDECIKNYIPGIYDENGLVETL